MARRPLWIFFDCFLPRSVPIERCFFFARASARGRRPPAAFTLLTGLRLLFTGRTVRKHLGIPPLSRHGSFWLGHRPGTQCSAAAMLAGQHNDKGGAQNGVPRPLPSHQHNWPGRTKTLLLESPQQGRRYTCAGSQSRMAQEGRGEEPARRCGRQGMELQTRDRAESTTHRFRGDQRQRWTNQRGFLFSGFMDSAAQISCDRIVSSSLR